MSEPLNSGLAALNTDVFHFHLKCSVVVLHLVLCVYCIAMHSTVLFLHYISYRVSYFNSMFSSKGYNIIINFTY